MKTKNDTFTFLIIYYEFEEKFHFQLDCKSPCKLCIIFPDLQQNILVSYFFSHPHRYTEDPIQQQGANDPTDEKVNDSMTI